MEMKGIVEERIGEDDQNILVYFSHLPHTLLSSPSTPLGPKHTLKTLLANPKAQSISNCREDPKCVPHQELSCKQRFFIISHRFTMYASLEGENKYGGGRKEHKKYLSLISYLFFRLDILINIRMGEGYRYVWLHSRNERK